ncbi:AP2-like ethylene-responsive transcription factor AIL1 [Impatiens glandulifera]|uniref:AP2-like ethylene-responsive transcription factor AIL1 n=1 Tax=Impatiens glandulifera TaxID=253017 RepID=UPI001FB0F750|nr:AP2-like ethylene-responsive transcription factor AIL1 [Impatiens glandulifera]
MSSMGNWLGFSLSPHHNSLINSDEISGGGGNGGDCFDLPTSHDSSTLPPPYGFLQAFNTNNNHSQDWSMKDMGSNPEDMPMTMNNNNNINNNGNSSSELGHHHHHHHQEPKLENFFGAHNYNNITTSSLQPEPTDSTSSGSLRENSTIGLSMIKNWLRNQPAPDNTTNGGGNSLSLSMSSGAHPGSTVSLPAAIDGGDNCSNLSDENAKVAAGATNLDSQINNGANRKSIDTFGQRTSIYRGVTRHRWTGRYEAHLWDNSCRREGQTRKGRQGGYDKEDKAARAYDLAALKYWGSTTTTNFPISNYEKELEEMKNMTRQEYVASLRRKSSGFSRGASIYRGVTRHHQHGRWQARIGRVAGNKDLYLGTFSTQEEAAEAYDIAAIKFRGLNAVTNFDMSRYDVKSILESSTLPVGGAAKRNKDAEQTETITAVDSHQRPSGNIGNMNDGSMMVNYGAHQSWPTIAYHQPLAQSYGMHNYPNYQQRGAWTCKQEQDLSNYQLQLGNTNTHNFFQNSIMQHNLIMGLDHSSSLEQQSSGSNSSIYGIGNGGDVNGAFAMPITTVIAQDNGNGNEYGASDHHEVKTNGYEGMFGLSDPYNNHSRNMYSTMKSDGYENEQGSSNCNTWNNIPTAVPATLSAPIRSIYHGAPPFTLWNDA